MANPRRPVSPGPRSTSPTAAVLALLAVAALASSGCKTLGDLAASAFEKPRLVFREAALQSVDLEGATVDFAFDLENPNAFGLSVARLGYAVEAGGTRVATGDLPGGLRIPASGKAPVTFPVKVRFRDVPGILELFGRSEALPYRLSGNVGVSTPIGVIDLPLSHAGHVALPRLPEFSLTGLRVRSAGFTEVSLDLAVRVKNPNAFPIPAGKLAWAAQVAGASVARGDAGEVPRVGAGGEATLHVPIKLSVLELGRAAQALSGGGQVEVKLDGNADVAGLPLPLKLHGSVPAFR